MIFKEIRILWGAIGLKRRYQLIGLIFLMLATSLAETISIGAIVPFLGVLVNPNGSINSKWFSYIPSFLNVIDSFDLVLFFSIIFIFTAFISSVIRVFFLIASIEFSSAIGREICDNVYYKFLIKPYSFHIEKNTSELIDTVLVKTSAVRGLIQSLLVIASSIFMLIMVFALLIAVNYLLVFLIALIFTVTYSLIVLIVRKKLKRNSGIIVSENQISLKSLNEGLGGIRDVILGGLQDSVLKTFSSSRKKLLKAESVNQILGSVPKYLLEGIGLILIAGFTAYVAVNKGNLSDSIPLLGVLALSAQRLMPISQQLYGAWANLKSSEIALSIVLKYLDEDDRPNYFSVLNSSTNKTHAIRFESVDFSYNSNETFALQNANIEIISGTKLGVFGPSGSGKSTFLDLLTGLLRPTNGCVRVNGINLDGEYLHSWHQDLAYVPQFVYLNDSTIEENIAFGIPVDDIDKARVRLAAEQAQLADFVKGLKFGYQTRIGERGVQLSGGQRQRIGIARAIYKNANVIIFDEATSALDNETEKSIMEGLYKIDSNKTIVMVTHRLSTLAYMNRVIEIKDGQIIENYNDKF
jgi:ATP-binding cassette subfamily B protein